jgi:hypothetical protein
MDYLEETYGLLKLYETLVAHGSTNFQNIRAEAWDRLQEIDRQLGVERTTPVAKEDAALAEAEKEPLPSEPEPEAHKHPTSEAVEPEEVEAEGEVEPAPTQTENGTRGMVRRV